jgi:hypothetical protein
VVVLVAKAWFPAHGPLQAAKRAQLQLAARTGRTPHQHPKVPHMRYWTLEQGREAQGKAPRRPWRLCWCLGQRLPPLLLLLCRPDVDGRPARQQLPQRPLPPPRSHQHTASMLEESSRAGRAVGVLYCVAAWGVGLGVLGRTANKASTAIFQSTPLSFLLVPHRFCDHTSAHKSAMTVHERRHTGEKPYKCQHCEYVGPQVAPTRRCGALSVSLCPPSPTTRQDQPNPFLHSPRCVPVP